MTEPNEPAEQPAAETPAEPSAEPGTTDRGASTASGEPAASGASAGAGESTGSAGSGESAGAGAPAASGKPDASAGSGVPAGSAAGPGGGTADTGEPRAGWLPGGAEELFGGGAVAEEAYDLLTVDVPAGSWVRALETARSALGCTYFDWLSAVDEPGTGFRVSAHLVALPDPATGARVRRLLLRTTVPHDAAELPTATGVYAGASWHERETHEMFGIGFAGHPGLEPLLLPDNFEGHPLRKDFVLASRVAKAWPGAKEPGESEHGGPKRRQMLPPGVPDPNEWGPLKGQLPPAPARPARGRAAGATAAGDRPARRTRTASAGSAGQQAEAGTGAGAETPPERPARRDRRASEGSASQQAERPARRARSVSEGSASRRTAASEEPREQQAPQRRTDDAPWHSPRPAFAEGTTDEDSDRTRTEAGEQAQPDRGHAGRDEQSGPEAGEPKDPEGGES